MNKNEYGTFYARTRDRVLSVTTMACGSRADAEAAIQQAYAMTTHDWARICPEDDLEEWVVKTAIRRVQKTQAGRHGNELSLDFTGPPLFTSEETAEACDMLDALGTLPLELRKTVVLCRLLGCPNEEVATMLNVPSSIIANRIDEGKANLKMVLDKAPLDVLLNRCEYWLRTNIESTPGGIGETADFSSAASRRISDLGTFPEAS